MEAEMPIVAIPTIRDYYMDLEEVLNISSDGPSKSFAFRRLSYLEGKWNLYFLLNEYQEMADSKVDIERHDVTTMLTACREYHIVTSTM